MNLLTLDFFRNALIGIVLISIASAVIGCYIVTRRMVSLAGGVTHACFGGLGLGYFLGLNPVLLAGVVAVASSLGVQWMSRSGRVRSDSAVAVIWAIGMAVGVVFVFLTPGYVPELNSFLFGNILTVTDSDLIVFAIFTAALLAWYIARFNVITAIAFDPDFARVSRLPVTFVTTVMTVFVAIAIVLTIRLVGVMLLMSMFSLPVMIAETFCRRMKPLVIAAVVAAVTCCTAGLLLGTVIDVPCSALIVLVLAGVWIATRCGAALTSVIRR